MKKIIIGLSVIFALFIGTVFGVNFYVKASTRNQIITVEKAKELNDVDCILVLGAAVWKTGPSPLLRDRLDKGIELYKESISSKVLMSGDHIKRDYDEVNAMKKYAIERGVESDNIFMDHAGISTYDSIYRLKEIFKVKKVVIVTQEYHLYRALYIANKLGIEAYGVRADSPKYSGDTKREVREILARDKDFIKVILKPKSTYLGETIDISKDGNITND